MGTGQATRSLGTRVCALALAVLGLVWFGSRANANDGDALRIGQLNFGQHATYLGVDPSNDEYQFDVMPDGAGDFVAERIFALQSGGYLGTAQSISAPLVAAGSDNGAEIYGADYGLIAYGGLSAGGAAIVANGESDGAYGVIAKGDPDQDEGIGVQATGGTGVDARGPIGVHAEGDTAIEAVGTVSFSSAGLVTIPQGKNAITITPAIRVHPNSAVLATAQTVGGQVARVTRNSSLNHITIFLAAKATKAVTVAYFVIG
jgi:hypothetical protein